MRRRATNSTGLSDTGSCFLPWPTGLAFVLGVSGARRRPQSAWISLTHTWTSRMSLTTLCGRCFAISCGAGHSTSWWLDHRHQSSRLLSGTRRTSVGSRSPVRGSTVCTRPKSSAYASPICWRSDPQRRAALCVRGRGDLVLQPRSCLRSPSVFDLAPQATVSWCRSLGPALEGRPQQWKRSSTILPACSQPRPRVTCGQQPLRGHHSSRKGPVAALRPEPVIVRQHLQPSSPATCEGSLLLTAWRPCLARPTSARQCSGVQWT